MLDVPEKPMSHSRSASRALVIWRGTALSSRLLVWRPVECQKLAFCGRETVLKWFTGKLCKAYEFMSHRIMILYLINESVLQEIRVERELLRTLKNRKKKWLGHIMRWNSLYRTVIEGKLEGRRGRGRRRPTLLGNLGGGRSYTELKRMAEDREGWRLSNL